MKYNIDKLPPSILKDLNIGFTITDIDDSCQRCAAYGDREFIFRCGSIENGDYVSALIESFLMV